MPDARRHGVATALTRILSAWALDDLGLARVQIHTERLNVASVGVAHTAGFTCEGILRSNEIDRCGVRRDDLTFSLLPSDPR